MVDFSPDAINEICELQMREIEEVTGLKVAMYNVILESDTGRFISTFKKERRE